MENFEDFKKYFNRDFWRAFKENQFIFTTPKTKELKLQILQSVYLEITNKSYFPDTPIRYIDLDKGNSVTRTIPVFTIRDYIVYYYCIKKIEDKIAINRTPNTFGGWTLGGLLRKSEDDELTKRKEDYDNYEDFLADQNGIYVNIYTFNPHGWAKAYGDLNSKLFASAKETQFNTLVELDISNYYDSIRLDILENRIRAIVDESCLETVNLLFMFLNYWNRKNNDFNKQTVGLPQDAMSDCSRILANFYLQSYDKYAFDLCNKYKAKYLRYSDDQFLFTKDEDTAHFLIFKLSKKLNSLGLSFNQKKVQIMNSKDVIKYRCLDIFSIIKDENDKKDVNKVETFALKSIELHKDQKLLEKTRDGGFSLIKRLLNCDAFIQINYKVRMQVIKLALSSESLKRADSYYLMKIFQILPKKYIQYLINVLISLSDSLLHNYYHYQLLKFYTDIKLSTVHIRARIKQLSSL